MDTHLHDQSGVATSREIRSQIPEIKVILLTSRSDDEAVVNAVVAGAAGYLLKEIRPADIVYALRRLGQGQSLLDPTVILGVLERVRRGVEGDESSSLTPLEQQILELVAGGRTDRQISETVALSEDSVRKQVTALWSKLEYSRRVQADSYTATWRGRIVRR